MLKFVGFFSVEWMLLLFCIAILSGIGFMLWGLGGFVITILVCFFLLHSL